MPFIPPNFNLTARVWRTHPGPFTSADPGGTDFPCQLRFYKTAAAGASGQNGTGIMFIAFPVHSDIRGSLPWQTNEGDVVECPQGSGRFYLVQMVDDVAKGFPNEYRLCVVVQTQGLSPLP